MCLAVFAPTVFFPDRETERDALTVPAHVATFAPSPLGTILIVSPNLDSDRELQDTLRGAGYVVEAMLEENVEHVSWANVEIVLLITSDSNPQTNSICSAIKSRQPIIPIIVIGPDVAPAKLGFFALGADDYVLHRLDRLELLARIKSQIRRYRLESQRLG